MIIISEMLEIFTCLTTCLLISSRRLDNCREKTKDTKKIIKDTGK